MRRRSLSVSISGMTFPVDLFAFELGFALFTKGADTLAMILAFDQDALRQRLERASGCEITGHRMPQDAFGESEGFRRPSKEVLGERSRMTQQLIVGNDSIHEPD